MLFTLFGMNNADSVLLSEDYSQVTVSTGYVLFGAYCWINVIIFLNMLIGMMAKAYDTISVSVPPVPLESTGPPVKAF